MSRVLYNFFHFLNRERSKENGLQFWLPGPNTPALLDQSRCLYMRARQSNLQFKDVQKMHIKERCVLYAEVWFGISGRHTC
jgi:hypothetical protein